MTRVRRIAIVALLGLVAAGCGDDGGGSEATGIEALDESAFEDDEVLGLRVEAEDLSEQLAATERSYAEAAGLFSLREGDELQATLQVTEFDADVDLGDRDVEGTILAQVTKTPPLRLRMGERTVFLSRANRQSVAVWFTDTHFFVLSTRDSYGTPRALLRTLTELETF